MKSTSQKLIDTFGCGFGLWILGFALGMMLFPFVPSPRLGLFILPVMTVVTVFVAFRRLARSGESLRYFAVVGATWLAIAVVFDYLFLVQAFEAEHYYDADIFVYYALSFLIPVLVGLRYGRA